MNQDWWPEVLRPLVTEFGGRAVWKAGFAALGYPPSWSDLHREALDVLTELQLQT